MSSLLLQLFFFLIFDYVKSWKTTDICICCNYLSWIESICYPLAAKANQSLLYVFPLGFELVYTSPLFEICLGTSGTLIFQGNDFLASKLKGGVRVNYV